MRLRSGANGRITKTVDRDFEQLAIRQRPAVLDLLEANARPKKETSDLDG